MLINDSLFVCNIENEKSKEKKKTFRAFLCKAMQLEIFHHLVPPGMSFRAWKNQKQKISLNVSSNSLLNTKRNRGISID